MATLLESYGNCFRKYATFRGRSARKEYAVFTVANFVLSAVLGLIPVIGGLFSLIIIIPGIAVAVRRLHDLNKSGWWLLAPFLILIIGLIGVAGTVEEGGAAAWVWLMVAGGIMSLVMSIWLLFARGTDGSNRFGDVQQDNDGSAPPGAQSAPVSSAEDVRARLAQATKMRDDGTISESEYETMRSSIIKDI
ncbi:uncharacterized membrane protein YhaH (DUF805 family) [Raoultella sp. BIGb0149]|uniref:DUF805 domain-containing protein n=1 Tax=Raoultella sp. BIGb0149 TaxID=2485116 RepID=UPI0010602269|nr:DUF805 domain-containing protein [Raoultella sp. BIGb0149]TDQ24657.1 uncharacterized membrane protein YhaH (DUF805 family) [Raoultella sp. BIGb0149]